MKSYIKNLMSIMSNIECLYQSLNVNDLTMNERLSTTNSNKKYQKIQKHSLSYHISQSPYTVNRYMTHSNIR